MFDDNIDVIKGDEIDLLLEGIYRNKRNVKLYVFHIYKKGKFNRIGRITLRLDENEEIYYIGHIGYNISKRYRGNYFAAKSCLLLKSLLSTYKVTKEIILTVNPNNIASYKTCKYIGCTFIDSVRIPKKHKLYTPKDCIKDRYLMSII